MEYVKWKMSEKDRNAYIKTWQDWETTFDLLIIRQKIVRKKLLKNLNEIANKVVE